HSRNAHGGVKTKHRPYLTTQFSSKRSMNKNQESRSAVRCGRIFLRVLTVSAFLQFFPIFVCPSAESSSAASGNKTSMNDNSVLTESGLPFHLPPFDKIRNDHFRSAYEKGMADELKEVDAIAHNPEKPTFENTIVALEKSGQLLGRVDRVFSNLN